jgi:hypothetical protein
VVSTDSTGANATICHKTQPIKAAVAQGPGTTVVEAALRCALPDLGDFQARISTPSAHHQHTSHHLELTLNCQLSTDNG